MSSWRNNSRRAMTLANFSAHEIDALLGGRPFAITSRVRTTSPTRALAVFLALAATPSAAHAGDNQALGMLIAIRPALMRDQGAACQQITEAGNARAGTLCFDRLKNAYRYLRRRARRDDVPWRLWSACSPTLDENLELGARCIAAAHWMMRNLPGPPSDRSMRASTVILSGAWVFSPAAAKLDLDTPADR